MRWQLLASKSSPISIFGVLLLGALGSPDGRCGDMSLNIFYTQYGFQSVVPTLSSVTVQYSFATNTISFANNTLIVSSNTDANFAGDDGVIVNPNNGDLLVATGIPGTVDQVAQNGAEGSPFVVGTNQPNATIFDFVIVPPNGTNSGFTPGTLIGTEKEFGHDYVTVYPLSPALAAGTSYPVTGDDVDVDSIAFDANGVAYYATGTVTSNAGNFGTVTFNGTNFITHRLFAGAFGSHRLSFDPFTGHIFAVGGNTVGQFVPGTSQFHILAINGVTGTFQLSTPLNDGQGHLLISACCGEPGDNQDGEGDLIVVDYSAAPGHLIDAATGVQYNHAFLAMNFVSAAANPLPLASIAVTPANPSMLPGTKQQMTATGTFQGGSTQVVNSQVTWSSSDSTIASVSNTGTVTAVAAGSAIISASIGGVKGTTTVTVPALVSITVAPANPTLIPGQTQSFTATGTYQGGATQSIVPTKWQSSDMTVATISSGGLASAIASGSSKISATLGSVTGSTLLTIPPLVSIAVMPANPSAYAGNTVQFTATGTYQGGATQSLTSQVTWASDNTGAATINASGLATAVAVGSAKISASLSGVSGNTTLTVPITPPSGLVLYYTFDTADDAGGVAVDKTGNGNNGTIVANPTQVAGKLNQALGFNGTNQYVSAPALSTTEFYNSVTVAAWIKTTNSSRYEAIVSKYSAAGSGAGYIFRTDANGNLEVLFGGSNISYGAAAAVDTTKINDGQWHHAVAVITPGQDVRFYVDGVLCSMTSMPILANGDNSANFTVASSSFSYFGNFFTGTIDEVRLYNRALTASEVNTVYVLSGGTPPSPLVSITVTPASPTINVGATQQFSATATYQNNSTQDVTSQAVWTSTSTAIATINSTGLAQGLRAGGTMIQASLSGINSNKASLTVQTPPPPTCPCTIWNSAATPATVDGGAGGSVELGIKFSSDISGTITGLRFYKSSSNTGQHVGNLWSSTGTLLATATFTNETSSGWQQVNFTPPVSIVANTVYVASYHTNVSHFSLNLNAFASAGVDNAPLHALASASSGGNGLYAYSSSSVFPTNTYQASNYWVDVVFSTASAPSLVSIAVTPANPAALNVGSSQQFVAMGTYQDNSTQDISAQVSWISSNPTAASINAAGLATAQSAGSSLISASLNGVSSNSATLTVQSGGGGSGCPCTIWSATATPGTLDAGAGGAVELGVKFRADSNGTISGLRFYKSSNNTGTHVGNLWSSSGVLLATATFSNETASGWQQVNFTPAVNITANTVYVASYHTNVSHFSVDLNAFASAGVDNGPLHALANGVSGGNGVYAYSSSSVFPANTYQAANYWVDVVYSPAPPPSCPCTIWSSSATPATLDAGAGGSVELGVKFTADSNGTITGLRFYKSAANTGTHVANLWSASGTLLATATFTNETASGWQQVTFSPGVAITAGTVYVASYHTDVSHFSITLNGFATGVDNPPLHALGNGVNGGDGVYAYSSASTFPTNTYQASNYWVDVVYQ